MILQLIGNDSNVCIVHCDVADKESVAKAAEKARDTFGIVTMLINNAGIV